MFDVPQETSCALDGALPTRYKSKTTELEKVLILSTHKGIMRAYLCGHDLYLLLKVPKTMVDCPLETAFIRKTRTGPHL